MPRISESERDPTQLAGALRDGIETLDLGQEVTFQAYTRVVLPVDGYVFWSPTIQKVVKGSLHYAQEIEQNEDELFGLANVTFTSECKITDFTDAPINTLWVARQGDFRYAFSQQQGFYSQAGLWHYFGRSVFPALASQLLDRPDSIDPKRAVTSNSLALWLALNTWSSPFNGGFKTGITLYPSFLTEPNLAPPYGAVHIGEDDTYPLQSTPYIDAERNHYQLVADRVQITLYGLQNDEALDFVDAVNSYSALTGNFGIMNVPVIRDAKRTQTELQAIAMKKVVEIEVSYYQTRIAQLARQLILSAQPTIIIGD
jgi:hypothetical protein